MDISVVCPVYNEEASIAEVLKDVREHLKNDRRVNHFEILMVDDGSEDQTLQRARQVSGVTILRNEVRRGYGASLKKGILAARYPIVLITDGDGTYPLDALGQMFDETPDYEMVVGERNLDQAGYSLARRIGKWALNLLVYNLTGRKIQDLNSGLRLMRKDAVIPFFPIISDGFSFTTTVTLAFLQSHLRVGFVPIQYRKRAGKSKIQPLRDTFRMIVQILQNIMFFNPLRIFASVAFLCFIFTALILFYDVVVRRNVGDAYLFFLIMGSTFLFAGLTADLIHKKFLLLEKKMTPHARRSDSSDETEGAGSDVIR